MNEPRLAPWPCVDPADDAFAWRLNVLLSLSREPLCRPLPLAAPARLGFPVVLTAVPDRPRRNASELRRTSISREGRRSDTRGSRKISCFPRRLQEPSICKWLWSREYFGTSLLFGVANRLSDRDASSASSPAWRHCGGCIRRPSRSPRPSLSGTSPTRGSRRLQHGVGTSSSSLTVSSLSRGRTEYALRDLIQTRAAAADVGPRGL